MGSCKTFFDGDGTGAELKELQQVSNRLLERIRNGKREGKKGALNAFKITGLLYSLYSKSTTTIREELNDLKDEVEEEGKGRTPRRASNHP